MKLSDVSELHYITPIANLASIFQYGLLSYNQVTNIKHKSIALPEVQDKRKRKSVPGGRPLHDYVNLYITARNPMLYKRLNEIDEICVLSISKDVLFLDAAIVTDRNAASDCLFSKAPHGLKFVDKEIIESRYWTDDNLFEEWRKKAIKCAEFLIPDILDIEYINKAYVANDNLKNNLERVLSDSNIMLSVEVNSYLYFR
jgi:hypothetical protein